MDNRLEIYTAAGKLTVTRRGDVTSVIGDGVWAIAWKHSDVRIDRRRSGCSLWLGSAAAFDLPSVEVAKQVADHLGIELPPAPQQVAA